MFHFAYLRQPVTGARIQIQPVELLQLLDALARRLLKRGSAVKGVQDDAFEQVAQTQIVKFGKRLEHFEQTLLHSHTGLDALDHKVLVKSCCAQVDTNVPR